MMRPNVIRWLFSFEGRVSQREYLTVGFSLMLLKYLGEALAAYLITHQRLEPLEFLFFSRGMTSRFDWYSRGYPIFVVLWSLPFLWIGLSMTVRRVLDAGFSAWQSLWFLVPFLNYMLMLILAVSPTDLSEREEDSVVPLQRGALAAIMVSVLIAVGGALLPHQSQEAYSAALFLGFPVMMGALAAVFVNGGRAVPYSALQIASAAALVGSLAIGLFALEGIICLFMAFPITFVGAFLGALLGNAMLRTHAKVTGRQAFLSLAIFFVISPPLEHLTNDIQPRVVVSSVVVDAPIETVWANVIEFPDLPTERSWIFHTGIAYPVRARLDGRGVGAVRHCEFSTGAFVEPITVWDPPTHLAFDVTSQPASMQESFLWGTSTPPHVLTAVQSKHGEFKLTKLSEHQTLLEGSTWYQLSLRPSSYWGILSDEAIHQIHMRVLDHIKTLSESR